MNAPYVGGTQSIVNNKKDPVALALKVPENERSRFMLALIAGRPLVEAISKELLIGQYLKATAMTLQVQWLCVDQMFYPLGPAAGVMFNVANATPTQSDGSVSDAMLAATIFSVHHNRSNCATLWQLGQGDTEQARTQMHQAVTVARRLVVMTLGDDTYGQRIAPYFPSDFNQDISRVLLWYALVNLYKCYSCITCCNMYTPTVPDDKTVRLEHLRVARQIMTEFPDRCLGPTSVVTNYMADFESLVDNGFKDGRWAEIVSLSETGIRLSKIDDDMLLAANYWNLACAMMVGACETEPGPGGKTFSRTDFEALVKKAREAEEPLQRIKRDNASDAFGPGKEYVESLLPQLAKSPAKFKRLPVVSFGMDTEQARQQLASVHGPVSVSYNEVGNNTPAEQCFNCGLQGAMNKCARCKKARYCTKNCQTLHWHAGHNVECKPLDKNAGKGKGGKKKKKNK